MNKILRYLNQQIAGNVFDKAHILDAYASDRSILKITPKLVAIPANTKDIRKLVRFSAQLSNLNFYLPITVRGSGLDKTGADIGSGLVISLEKLNRIQEIDTQAKLVRVQAGATLGEINNTLALSGLTLPVKAHPSQTISDLINNSHADPWAGKYGGIYRYVERIEVITADGNRLQTTNCGRHGLKYKQKLNTTEGAIYRGVDHVLDAYSDVLDDHIAKRREERLFAAAHFNINASSDFTRSPISPIGYQMISQVRQGSRFNLMPLFFSAQGTLGIVSEVILRCEPIPPHTQYLALTFRTVKAVLDFLAKIELQPVSADIYDANILRQASEQGKALSFLSPKFDSGYLLLLHFHDSERKVYRKFKKIKAILPPSAHAILEDKQNSAEFRAFDKLMLNYLNSHPEGERIAFFDDFYIPRDHLRGFLAELEEYQDVNKIELSFFGSLATQNYSLRPGLPIDALEGRQLTLKLLKDLSNLVAAHGGSIASGAPEGRVKGVITTPNLTERERLLYRQIKLSFDPNNIFNPEVKLGADLRTTIRQLRTTLPEQYITE